jgi:acetoin utilization protein AcuB
MPVSERMRSPVVTIGPNATVREAVEVMTTGKLRHLPVVDGDRLLGIVTDRDLRQAVFAPIVQERLGAAGDAVGDIAVREVMTWAVITVGPATDLREAARLMHEQKIGALPVVEDARLIGILTESDVLAALEEALRADVSTVRPLSARPSADVYEYGFRDPGGDHPWPEETGPGNPEVRKS